VTGSGHTARYELHNQWERTYRHRERLWSLRADVPPLVSANAYLGYWEPIRCPGANDSGLHGPPWCFVTCVMGGIGSGSRGVL
jgi:hypothetical protein